MRTVDKDELAHITQTLKRAEKEAIDKLYPHSIVCYRKESCYEGPIDPKHSYVIFDTITELCEFILKREKSVSLDVDKGQFCISYISPFSSTYTTYIIISLQASSHIEKLKKLLNNESNDVA